jgi:hypothetical protein
MRKKILRHKRGIQYPYIEEGHTIQWPEETFKETKIDLSNTTQNIQQKHGDLNNSFFMITMYMYLFN